MIESKYLKLIILAVLLLSFNIIFAQTTGKISGTVEDKENGEPLWGVNVLLTGKWINGQEVDVDNMLGAATDNNGNYFILNVDPGEYTVTFQMMGYDKYVVRNVVVSTNRTSKVNGILNRGLIQGEDVVVIANKLTAKKDQTNSVRNVSGKTMQTLPVESVSEVIEMQAGVVNGHFRGGRNTEVSYMIDGMQIDNGFSKTGSMVSMETDAVQDIEVIIGTFNAEYGRAMSGIVNQVSKDGQSSFHGSMSGSLSNYITGNNDVFIGLKNSDIARNQDYKFQLEGPLIGKKLTFFTNIRYQNKLGHLNGKRRFNVDDYSNFSEQVLDDATEETPWDYYAKGSRFYSEHTGDNDFVPMSTADRLSAMGKISFKISPSLKMSIMYIGNESETSSYNHSYKYNPDGLASNHDGSQMYLFQFNHFVSTSLFYDLKVSHTSSENGFYLYENSLDSRYVNNFYQRGATDGFLTGGQDRTHYNTIQEDLNVKFDANWQANYIHNIKLGFVYTDHEINRKSLALRNQYYNSSFVSNKYYDVETGKLILSAGLNNDGTEMVPYYQTEIIPDSSVSTDIYTKSPYEFSTYIQDKMEFESMVLNVGLRFDYFNSNSAIPSQLRNPGNQANYPSEPERMSTYEDAEEQMQVSPRFGIAYSLGRSAVFHMAYGHFFQMPQFSALYQNADFALSTGNFQTIHGYAGLKAEKTVQYEMGIWQEITRGLGLEINVFYRDIYNLLSTRVITTYNSIKYGLYTNKDYGNAKGMELKLDYMNGPFSAFVNYTLQYTRGNADNPSSQYTREGNNQDPISILYQMPWDQRHTFNVSIGYNKLNYGLNISGYYNSGLPYTLIPIQESILSRQQRDPNDETRPSTFTIDLKGNYDFQLTEKVKMRLYLSVYNLLDQLNEVEVNSTTGRAYTTVITSPQLSGFTSNYNDIYDMSQNPVMYATPREVKIGLAFMF